MRNRVGLLISLFAVAGWAGTRFKDTTGTLPTSATDGVALTGVTSCRGSVRYTDGGTASGGKLVPYYRDSILGWVEGPKSDQCSLDTDVQVDGGARQKQVCAWLVSTQYGRAALVPLNVTPQNAPIVRLECWGADLPNSDGGAQ